MQTLHPDDHYKGHVCLLACVLLSCALLVPRDGQGQDRTESVSESDRSVFAPIDLRDPNRYRNGAGRPGPGYWQNEADYQIDVTLDTARNRLSGTQTITYTNNAPQPLRRLWVQLEQNFFRPDSRGAQAALGERFSGFFDGAGYTISRVQVRRDEETVTPDTLLDGTRMRVSLDEPLPADGGTLTLTLDWRFEIPEDGADRHGITDVEQGTIYQLAQWYPRMYVYNDVHGWNAMPYLGQGEYYLEYGTFNVNITVPRDMIVAATGRLQNPDEVLTETQHERLREARDGRETVSIIDSTEVGSPSTRPDGEGPLTWRYEAERVRDVAWAASDAFLWDAARAEAGGEVILAQSFYPKEGLGIEDTPGWERSTEFVQHSVEFYSDFVAPYPYPTATNVAGRVTGMEYPQIAFCDMGRRGQSLFGVTDHEFGHTWFPMVVGSDERRWAWMDEGLNQFMNQYSEIAFYEDQEASEALESLSSTIAGTVDRPIFDQPIMTYADQTESIGLLAYLKPASGLMLLREHVVGPDAFDAAFKAYFDRWAYKHPKPADFFRTLEDVTGENLDWFWRSWFYETDVADPAVASVDTADAPGDTTVVAIEQRGDLMLPLPVRFTYEDGATENRRISEEAFLQDPVHTVRLTEARLQRVTIDPNRLLPDTSRANNGWLRGDRADAGGLSRIEGENLEPMRLTYEGTRSVSRTITPVSEAGAAAWSIVHDNAETRPDTLVVDRETLLPRSQATHARAQNQRDVSIQLTYDSTSVRGTMEVGPRSIPVDASAQVPVLVEGNSFRHPLFALAAMPLDPGFSTEFTLFNFPRDVVTARYEVTGTTEVETPAGSFATYIVEMNVGDGRRTRTAYLRQQAPYYPVKLTRRQDGETVEQTLTGMEAITP